MTSPGFSERLQAALGSGYTIERELGGGGMSRVFVAEETAFGRQVVIKVLPPELAAAVSVERFRREIQLAAQLQHPNIVPLHAAGVADDLPYFTMPFVTGETLRARIARSGELPVNDTVKILRDVLTALSYAHEKGVVHRDIKPDNVLLTKHHALVADFGVAKAISASAASGGPVTSVGIALGTPAYMAPEQAAADPSIDHRADLYAVGILAYEMLTGYKVFGDRTPQQMLAAHAIETPEPIQKRRPTVPPRLAQLVMSALEKHPADRPQTADEMLATLDAIVTSAGALAFDGADISSGDIPEAAPPPQRRKSAQRLYFLLALLFVLAVATWGLLSHRRDPTTRTAEFDQQYVVAVLPFENLSADSSKGYFAAGFTQEVTSELSRLSALRVASRSSLAPFMQAADRLKRMNSELGVGSVVEGNVRISGDSARVGVQLTDARSARVIWTQEYESPLSDALTIQSRVANGIVKALEASLTPEEARRSGHRATIDPAAYELYMRTLQMSQQSVTTNTKAIGMLNRAVTLDSTFARAYSQLARRYQFMPEDGTHAYIDSGMVAAKKAMQLDPGLADAYVALGDMQMSKGKIGAARIAFKNAVTRDRSNTVAMNDLSVAETLSGHHDEALYWTVRALQANPRDAMVHFHVAAALANIGADEEAKRFISRAETKFPEMPRLAFVRAGIEVMQGRDSVGMEMLRLTVAHDPDNHEAASALAEMSVLTRASDAESLLHPIATAAPEIGGNFVAESFRTLYAWALWRRGDRRRAEMLLQLSLGAATKRMKDGVEDYSIPMEIAAIYALRSDRPASLSWLQRAYAAGFRDYRTLARDPLFDSIRDEPAYRQLSARIAADVAAMRRRAAANNTLANLRE